MSNNQSTVYSRDEFISELTSFYEFLVKLHLPSSAMKYPPPGGWPDITPQYLAFLKKNDTVIDLIQHMPFIRRDDEFDPYQIYEKTSAVDYNGQDFKKQITVVSKPSPDIADPMAEATSVPSHVVTLAQTSGGRDGYYILLDTERGTITICDFQIGPRVYTELSQNIRSFENKEETWRCYATYSVKDFFEMLNQQYRSFEVATDVIMAKLFPPDVDIGRLKEIYRECGWGSESYRKEECMKKVAEAWEEIWC